MPTHEEIQQRRIQRAERRLKNHRAKSDEFFERSHERAKMIPPDGQPILIGHHSEKRHRNAIEKSHRLAFKGVEESRLADQAEHLLARIESDDTISSDASDAIEQLKEKLERLEGRQAFMKLCNAAVRKGKSYEGRIACLLALDLPITTVMKLLTPDVTGAIGFPRYALTNNNANIKRLKTRIEQLQKVKTLVSEEITIGDVNIALDTEANRVKIFFPVKPNREIINMLKCHGFHWSPFNKAWQRMISRDAIYHAKDIASKANPEVSGT